MAKMTVCYAPVLISHIEFDKGYKVIRDLIPCLIQH